MRANEMDQQDAYAAASELAFSGRHRDARDALKALLQRDPAHVEALILLGKVEYYLGHAAASRRSFEIALSYEPGNMAAFFGMEYHRQRARSLFLVAGIVLLLAAIGVATVFLAHRLASVEHQLDARLGATSIALSGSVNRLGSVVEELRNDLLGRQEDTEQALSGIGVELGKLRRAHADLMRELEELRKAALAGYQERLNAP